MGSCATSLLILLLLLLTLLSISSSSSDATAFKGIDLENPVLDVTPFPLPSRASVAHGSKDVLSCGRVQVVGKSRLKLRSYASSYQVTLAPSAAIPERLHAKIEICFHHNVSLGLCQCEKGEWRSLQKGVWRSFMSPYENRYIDVKFVGEVSGSVTVTVEEEFQRWRLVCLAMGLALLLLAPIVSSWVPFYYSSSMAIGVILVILILLFQGMKLLPAGRKNVFYLTVYGSVIGAGSYLLHYFSMLVNSILVNFGLSEEMHNPVSVLLLVLIVLAGAALGYWIVRKFVISEDGSVDVGIAQFMKWAMRIVAATCIFQSTLDIPLAVGSLVSCLTICRLITHQGWHGLLYSSYSGNPIHWPRGGGRAAKYSRAEFLSRKKNMGAQGTLWSSPHKSPAWSKSPIKGLVSPASSRGTGSQDYYSSFHKTPNRKKFSKKEWKEFTQESTRQAVSEWASSPEFADWIIKHSDRIQLLPDESSDETIGSGSDSTDENAVESGTKFGLFKWHQG